MTNTFDLAPIKHEGYRVVYEGEINPYEHPKWVYPHRRREVARRYFTWELLHGTPVEDLKKDSCWKYYEQD